MIKGAKSRCRGPLQAAFAASMPLPPGAAAAVAMARLLRLHRAYLRSASSAPLPPRSPLRAPDGRTSKRKLLWARAGRLSRTLAAGCCRCTPRAKTNIRRASIWRTRYEKYHIHVLMGRTCRRRRRQQLSAVIRATGGQRRQRLMVIALDYSRRPSRVAICSCSAGWLAG